MSDGHADQAYGGLYDSAVMRRALHDPAPDRARCSLLAAPIALAADGHDGGEGWYGETNDKVVTNAGFILIAAFPLLILSC